MAKFAACVMGLAGLPLAGCRSAAPLTSPGIAQVSGADVEQIPAVKAQVAPATRNSSGTTSGEATIRLASDEQAKRPTAAKSATAFDLSTNKHEQPQSSISLTDAVSLSLEQNPDLVALRQNDLVGVTALGVAQTYPFNPYVQVQATPYQDARERGPGSTYHYVLLMQNIQLARQQQFREQGAEASLNTIRWNVHQAELLNVAQTQRLYYTAVYLRGIRDLAEASAANNDQLLNTLEKQLAAGNATAADVAIVRVDARSTRTTARLAEANYQTALRDFRRQLTLSPTASIEPAGDLRQLRWRPATALACQSPEDAALCNESFAVIASELAAARPDVLSARSDVDAAHANLSLATANKTPDLQVGPYYQRTADGTTFVGFRAQMDIPVFNNGSPLQRQRHAELSQKVTAWKQLHTRAALDAEAALERYHVALGLVGEEVNEQDDSLPGALQKLEEQFKAGEVDIIRVIQARTSLIQNRRAKLDSLNELAQSAANLVAASGVVVELSTLDGLPPGDMHR